MLKFEVFSSLVAHLCLAVNHAAKSGLALAVSSAAVLVAGVSLFAIIRRNSKNAGTRPTHYPALCLPSKSVWPWIFSQFQIFACPACMSTSCTCVTGQLSPPPLSPSPCHCAAVLWTTSSLVTELETVNVVEATEDKPLLSQ